MPTLYTPEAKTQGLDWLAGMVQTSQQLWQRERSLAQEAQRLQVAKQQQKIQADQFWATQARLKDQQDFQDRKFLYDVKDTERKFEWGKIKDNRTLDLTARQEDRLAAGQEYAQDPNNPDNRYRAAATGNLEATAELTKAKTAEMGADPWEGVPFLPTEGEPGASNSGTQLLPDMSQEDGVWKPRSWKTGDPMNPVAGVDALGNKYSVGVAGVGANNKPYYQTQFEPQAKPVDEGKVRRDEIDDMRTRLASLTSAKKALPAAPTAPKGGEVTQEQRDAYQKQVTEAERSNSILNRQVESLNRDLRVREAQARMVEADYTLQITPAFQGVAPMFMDAMTRKDPIALENLRVQVKPLADDGDPAAKKALKIMDDVLGEAVEPKAKTPYF
jgi:hypothetical protein